MKSEKADLGSSILTAESRSEAVEPRPLGKALYLAVCKVRGMQPDRAKLEWQDWEGDFMTKDEWQAAAAMFAASARFSAVRKDEPK